MKGLGILALLALLLLAACGGPATTHYAQSAYASCTGWFCRATATNYIVPTQAAQIADGLALALAVGLVIALWAALGALLGWWGGASGGNER